LVIVLVAYLSGLSLAQTPLDTRQLDPGKPIEGKLAGGDAHAYSIELTAGQFCSVIVDQRGVDVVVRLFAPDGKQLREVDSPNGIKGPEAVLFVAGRSGTHQIKVHSLDKTAATGGYEIKVEALRTATAQEKLASEAKDLAQVLALAKTEEERATILAQKKELITVELIRSLSVHARDLRNLRKLPQALALSRFSLGLAEQLGDKTGIAESFYNIGYVFFLQSNPEALGYLQKSLSMREELGEKARAGDSANLIGVVFHRRRDLAQALEFLPAKHELV